MKRTIAASIFAALLVLVAQSSPASAQGFCGGGWGGCGANYPYGLYGNRINEIPYFSLFPPVYYSMPVPRTYGWSPFAYPPGTMTPEVATDQPQDVINPYVPQNNDSKQAKPMAAKVASLDSTKVQVVINPFVKADSNSAVAAK
jgi:hypothetical protein